MIRAGDVGCELIMFNVYSELVMHNRMGNVKSELLKLVILDNKIDVWSARRMFDTWMMLSER